MNNLTVDVDPLSSFEYPQYNQYPNNDFSYDLKAEEPNIMYKYEMFPISQASERDENNDTNKNNKPSTHLPNNEAKNPKKNDGTAPDQPHNPEEEDVKPIIDGRKVKKERIKGRTSSYWSVKIADKDFAFYGCAVCNLQFKSLHELDQHVTIHKDRITSYDLRLKNQMLKKSKNKGKKLKKVKEEVITKLEIEIKPEDGYIGEEKAADFEKKTENTEGSIGTGDNQDSKCDDKKDLKNININCSEKKKEYNMEKIYKCFACQKQFLLSYYLKLHVRSHTDEKPYTCSICGQSFITASHLGRHNKRIHLAVKHQCRICYKFFSRFELLTRHFDKKHPADKLEGEPYDYNVILPYLKELEEQLRQKSEEDKKPKTEDLWGDKWPLDEPSNNQGNQDQKLSESDNKDFDVPLLPPENIMVEPATISDEISETHIKLEVEDASEADVEPEAEPEADAACDAREDSIKDESCSDDDYFPSNTWASTPDIGPPPPSPPRKTRRSKTDEHTLKCDVCQKTISSISYMRVHMRTHTGERPFKCYVCGRGFITSSKMHRHVLTHSETWDDSGNVKDEKKEVKKKDGETNENGDERTDTEKNEKETHPKKAKGKFAKKRKKGPKVERPKKKYQKRLHACEFCHKRFLHVETLQVHKKSHEGEELVIKCTYCLAQFDDEASMRQHEKTHDGPKPYLCTLCGKTYKKRETMMYHRKHHKAVKEFACAICEKRFNAQCKLQRHIVTHGVDKYVLRYECPVCAHMFNTKYHIQMHLATHQKEGSIVEENRNEILAMVLQNARKIPKGPDASANVTDIIPADERSRVCNICGEVFQHFYYLEEHLKSHGSKIAVEDLNKTEEKKYICPICNKSFKLHYYLKLHSFTHSKEKPFICQQCGKGFITRGKLKRHLETHTGLKKYQCHICYKFFTRPSYLRIHVRTIHGTQDYNFRIDKDYSVGTYGALSVSDMSQSSL